MSVLLWKRVKENTHAVFDTLLKMLDKLCETNTQYSPFRVEVSYCHCTFCVAFSGEGGGPLSAADAIKKWVNLNHCSKVPFPQNTHPTLASTHTRV
jgi:hypothetical protein